MPVERALKAYKKEHLNCAQSILRAFQDEQNISEEEIIKAKQFGGGQAEGGVCGALYAALMLIKTEHVRDHVRKVFAAKAESDKCVEIRISCGECVRIAAILLVEHDAAGPAKSAALKNIRQ